MVHSLLRNVSRRKVWVTPVPIPIGVIKNHVSSPTKAEGMQRGSYPRKMELTIGTPSMSHDMDSDGHMLSLLLDSYKVFMPEWISN